MKKINKKEIVILIVLIIMLIIQIKAFNNSRANNLKEITATVVDTKGLLSDETCTITAINEAESGMSITLPNIINTKKVSKYIVTKKEIIETNTDNIDVTNTNIVDTNETNTVITDTVDNNATSTDGDTTQNTTANETIETVEVT